MKSLTLAIAFAAAAASFALLELRTPERRAPAVEAKAVPTVAVVPVEDVRPRIAAEVQRERPRIHTSADIDRYLNDLEAQARRAHRVTALEVEPGLVAIAERSQSPEQLVEQQRAFAERMQKLSADLDGRR